MSAVSSVQYVNISRTDYITEDRAERAMTQITNQRAMMERDGYVDPTLSQHREGSVVVIFTAESMPLFRISQMVEQEKDNRHAQDLIAGRKILEGAESEHGSGLTYDYEI
jgi:hypothetical protein